jgi:hypothetical protein
MGGLLHLLHRGQQLAGGIPPELRSVQPDADGGAKRWRVYLWRFRAFIYPLPPPMHCTRAPLKVRAALTVCLRQASGSWDLATCCAGSGNDCGGIFCYDRTSASKSFLFSLGPEAPERFGPTGLNTFYQFVHPLGWPVWGAGILASTDLFVGEFNGTLGATGDCHQGVTFTGSVGQICGGRDNWGKTGMEVWRLA